MTLHGDEVVVSGHRLALSPHERAVFTALYVAHGGAVPAAYLQTLTRAAAATADRAPGLARLISSLRRKLAAHDPAGAAWIVTVRAYGYRLELPGWAGGSLPSEPHAGALTLAFGPDFAVSEDVWQIAFTRFPRVASLLAAVERRLAGQVPPASYGLCWLLCTHDGRRLRALGSPWAPAVGTVEKDPRSLQEAGVQPGMVLRVARLGAGPAAPVAAAHAAGAASAGRSAYLRTPPAQRRVLGEFVRRRREQLGLQPLDVAARAGLPVRTVQHLEAGGGTRTFPGRTLRQLAVALEVPLATLIGLAVGQVQ